MAVTHTVAIEGIDDPWRQALRDRPVGPFRSTLDVRVDVQATPPGAGRRAHLIIERLERHSLWQSALSLQGRLASLDLACDVEASRPGALPAGDGPTLRLVLALPPGDGGDALEALVRHALAPILSAEAVTPSEAAAANQGASGPTTVSDGNIEAAVEALPLAPGEGDPEVTVVAPDTVPARPNATLRPDRGDAQVGAVPAPPVSGSGPPGAEPSPVAVRRRGVPGVPGATTGPPPTLAALMATLRSSAPPPASVTVGEAVLVHVTGRPEGGRTAPPSAKRAKDQGPEAAATAMREEQAIDVAREAGQPSHAGWERPGGQRAAPAPWSAASLRAAMDRTPPPVPWARTRFGPGRAAPATAQSVAHPPQVGGRGPVAARAAAGVSPVVVQRFQAPRP